MPAGFDIRIAPNGMHVKAGDTRFHFQLVQMGYGLQLASVGAVEPQHRRSRWELRRDIPPVCEWYYISDTRVDHGFELPRRMRKEELPLRLVVRVGPSLSMNLSRTDGSIRFFAGVTSLLRYARREATDSVGQSLASRLLVVGGSQFAIEVEDHKATYPISIGPPMPKGSAGKAVAVTGDSA